MQPVVKEEIVQPKIEKEDEKDEAVIQHLLEDIKGSFESQFEMDLQNFGSHETQTFSNHEFSMSNTFNLSSLDDLSKDSFVGPPALSTGVTSGSSDAMFGGAGPSLELPGLVDSWEEKEREENSGQGIPYGQVQNNLIRQNLTFVGRAQGQGELSQDLAYSRVGHDDDYRGQHEIFSREPEDLTFSNRRPEDLTFSHRPPEDLSFGQGEPEDLTFTARPPDDLTFGNTEPEDLTFGSNRSNQQNLASGQTNSRFGTTSAFLSAGTISQEQFLNMFDQD